MKDHTHAFRVLRDEKGRPYLECPVAGEHLINSPIFNKGTAFSESERDEFGLRGLLPPQIDPIEEQVARNLSNYRQKTTDLERYIFLISLMDRNETLFFRLVMENLEEMLPIIYTPTVGQACVEFGRVFRRTRGMYVSIEDRGRVKEILRNWPYRTVKVIVVTDGERILGLGDLGANGMGIPIGKLSLYVAAGGINPVEVLPVCLDAGTGNEKLRDDPFYIGLPRERVRGEAYDALVEEFVQAAREVYPGVLIQFEDFAEENADRLLKIYRDRICCFNDDIQGTGAVALASLLTSARITKRRLADERIVIAGAGAAGTGIAWQIIAAMDAEGLNEDQAKKRMWLLDSKGLLTASRGKLAAHKMPFARDEDPKNLEEIVRAVRPTVLVGVTGRRGLFTEPILKSLADRPLVLPLSNPTKNSECTAAEARKATGGQALVATGSPFPDTSQCNNVYIFPGVGLGVITSGAERVTDKIFLAAARAVADRTTEAELAKELLLPPLSDIRAICADVATRVAIEAGSDKKPVQWQPVYLPYRKAPDAVT
jgi:malate dehydrogenase (oxaloacetate-decarboxylating)(NADP+)